MKRIFLMSLSVCLLLTACNKKSVFQDYKYTTVYFPYQSPVRTLVLGDDIIDNTMDNQHKFSIMAAMGGAYENTKNITLTVAVDNTLAQRLKFNAATGDSVFALPSNYYTLPADMKITIPSGSTMGGIDVQLTDAFFADPRAIKKAFIVPLKIVSVTNADSVLKGSSTKTSPDRRVAGDWAVAPKDFTLYAVKYINPYHANYLRRGIDNATGTGGNTALDTNVVYHALYVEQNEVCSAVTTALDEVSVSLNAKNKGNINAPFTMLLKFDSQGKCVIRNPALTTYTITGSGQFVKNGDSWGNQPRNVLYLKYQVAFGPTTHNLTDTIVVRDRGVALETFNPVVY